MNDRKTENCSHRIPYGPAEIRTARRFSCNDSGHAKGGTIPYHNTHVLCVRQSIQCHENPGGRSALEYFVKRFGRGNHPQGHDPLMEIESDDFLQQAFWSDESVEVFLMLFEECPVDFQPFGRQEDRNNGPAA